MFVPSEFVLCEYMQHQQSIPYSLGDVQICIPSSSGEGTTRPRNQTVQDTGSAVRTEIPVEGITCGRLSQPGDGPRMRLGDTVYIA